MHISFDTAGRSHPSTLQIFCNFICFIFCPSCVFKSSNQFFVIPKQEPRFFTRHKSSNVKSPVTYAGLTCLKPLIDQNSTFRIHPVAHFLRIYNFSHARPGCQAQSAFAKFFLGVDHPSRQKSKVAKRGLISKSLPTENYQLHL